MNNAVLIDNRIAVRREGAAQCYVRIKHAGLVKVHHAQEISAADFSPPDAGISPRNKRRSVVLPLPFGPTSPRALPAVTMKSRSAKKRCAADAVAHMLQLNQPFGLRSEEKIILALAVRVRIHIRQSAMSWCAVLILALALCAGFRPRRSHQSHCVRRSPARPDASRAGRAETLLS